MKDYNDNAGFCPIITTSRHPDEAEAARAAELAAQIGGQVVKRGSLSLKSLGQKYGVPAVVVAREGTIAVETLGGAKLFFHPSMAHVRLKNLRSGGSDHLIGALGLTEGMTVIDCTLGLGADAIVESYAVGAAGTVIALEINPLVAAVVAYGLKHYAGEANEAVIAAMRRVQVVNADYENYLSALPDNSADAVYFDPMFRYSLEKSVALAPLRHLADTRPVSAAAIGEAIRVARRRVVLKEAWYSQEFARLGFSRFVGGKYSRIRFGVIDKAAL